MSVKFYCTHDIINKKILAYLPEFIPNDNIYTYYYVCGKVIDEDREYLILTDYTVYNKVDIREHVNLFLYKNPYLIGHLKVQDKNLCIRALSISLYSIFFIDEKFIDEELSLFILHKNPIFLPYLKQTESVCIAALQYNINLYDSIKEENRTDLIRNEAFARGYRGL